MKSVPLVPPYIESLRPYEAGRTIESVRKQYGLSHVAKLASNENPLGASPKAIEAMTQGAERAESLSERRARICAKCWRGVRRQSGKRDRRQRQ